jgi:hypothetical protein
VDASVAFLGMAVGVVLLLGVLLAGSLGPVLPHDPTHRDE